MPSDYIVTELTRNGEKFLAAALYEDGSLAMLRMEKEQSDSITGCIYRGVVDSVSKNISSAFIDIGRKDLCFLTMGKQKVLPSSKVTVQITKDAAGLKQPCCSLKLSVPGRFAVVSDTKEGISYSSKLTAEQKDLIGKWIDPAAASGFHFLIRTNAAYADKASLNAEIAGLSARLQSIREKAETAKSRTLLYAPKPFYVQMLRDFYKEPDRVRSDIPKIAEELSCPLYEDRSLSLADLKGLPHDLDRLTQKKVWLKCGGFLVIEQTEAFASIDVNTGKCLKGRIAEETYRKVNLEAAAEAARQISLRNLSGMILIDFINMENPDHSEELFSVMKKLLRKDHVHAEAVDLTKLGILEILRQKIEKPLSETLGGTNSGNT